MSAHDEQQSPRRSAETTFASESADFDFREQREMRYQQQHHQRHRPDTVIFVSRKRTREETTTAETATTAFCSSGGRSSHYDASDDAELANIKSRRQLPPSSSSDHRATTTKGDPSPGDAEVESVATSSSMTSLSTTTDKNDETWAARLEELRAYRDSHGHVVVPKKCHAHPQLGIWVMNQRAQKKLYSEGKPTTLTAERLAALEDLGFVWSLCDHVDWDSRLEELRRYKAKYGNCLVPNKFFENPQLGTWVNKQRTQYKLMTDGKASSMTPVRVKALESLGFIWSKRDLVDWEARLDELRRYKTEHGDCLVPNKYGINPQLGTWVMHQRAQYRKWKEGRPSPMTTERVQKLESLGFAWSTSNLDADWDARLQELRSFKKEHGHCRVPNKYPENPKLGTWVSKQRKQFKLLKEGKSSTLTRERVNTLERIGFSWSLRNLVDWEARHKELRMYKAKHGDCLVPQQYPMNPQLGTWVSNQRKQYRLLKEGKPSPMNKERIRALEALGFVWSIFNHEDPFDARVAELTSYKEKYGDCRVPDPYPENQTLSTWVRHQRVQYGLFRDGRLSALTPERADELEKLGLACPPTKQEEQQEKWEDESTTQDGDNRKPSHPQPRHTAVATEARENGEKAERGKPHAAPRNVSEASSKPEHRHVHATPTYRETLSNPEHRRTHAVPIYRDPTSSPDHRHAHAVPSAREPRKQEHRQSHFAPLGYDDAPHTEHRHGRGASIYRAAPTTAIPEQHRHAVAHGAAPRFDEAIPDSEHRHAHIGVGFSYRESTKLEHRHVHHPGSFRDGPKPQNRHVQTLPPPPPTSCHHQHPSGDHRHAYARPPFRDSPNRDHRYAHAAPGFAQAARTEHRYGHAVAAATANYPPSPPPRTDPRRPPPHTCYPQTPPLDHPGRNAYASSSYGLYLEEYARGSPPMRCSPTRAPPATISRARGSPSRGSPTRGSPTRGSPMRTSPTRGSPTRSFPARGSPTRGSPARGSPTRGSPTRSSPSKQFSTIASAGSAFSISNHDVKEDGTENSVGSFIKDNDMMLDDSVFSVEDDRRHHSRPFYGRRKNDLSPLPLVSPGESIEWEPLPHMNEDGMSLPQMDENDVSSASSDSSITLSPSPSDWVELFDPIVGRSSSMPDFRLPASVMWESHFDSNLKSKK